MTNNMELRMAEPDEYATILISQSPPPDTMFTFHAPKDGVDRSITCNLTTGEVTTSPEGIEREEAVSIIVEALRQVIGERK